MYLVVLEAEDGSWMSDPNAFDTLSEAMASIGDDRGGGSLEWVFYECRQLSVELDAKP